MYDENLGMFGHLEIYEVCKITGRSYTILDSRNKIVDTGFKSFLEGISDSSPHKWGFGGIFLGDDVGMGGTIDSPTPPTVDMKAQDQNLVYRVLNDDTFVDYPSHNKIRFTTVVNGDELYRLYPDSPRVIITSASIRNRNGDVVAYRRFPGRTASPLITLNIRWTLTVNDQCDDVSVRYVTDVYHYVMENLDGDLINPNPSPPEELQYSDGSYVNDWLMGSGSTECYVIPLVEWSDGTIEAMQFDEDMVPNNQLFGIDWDRDAIQVEKTHKNYILKVTAMPPTSISTISTTAGGMVGMLSITKNWMFEAGVSGMIPVGDAPESEYSTKEYWKFPHLHGALYGPPSIGGEFDVFSPSRWNYELSEDGFICSLINITTNETHQVIHHTKMNHVAVAFDGNMRPIIVFSTGEREVHCNYWKNGAYTTNFIGNGISPFVVNPSMNTYVSSAPEVYLLYVDYDRRRLISRSISDDFSSPDTHSDTNVVDILQLGMTGFNGMRLVYVVEVSGVPEIRSIGGHRGGIFSHDNANESRLVSDVRLIGVVDNRKTETIFELPILPTISNNTSNLSYKIFTKTTEYSTEKRVNIGILPSQSYMRITDVNNLHEDTFYDQPLPVNILDIDVYETGKYISASDDIGDVQVELNIMRFELIRP